MAKTTKGELTKARIVSAALELFRQHGYEATTMRAVAEAAGVSLGNAYYYFSSKEYLLQAYYHEIHVHHMEQSLPVLEREKGLKARLLGVIKVQLQVIEPYHRFSGLLFKTAGDPHSPLNPFHEDSAATRLEATELFAKVIEGKGVKVPKDLRAELPQLLWVYSMGIVLFWIHDKSAGRARTHALVEQSVDVVARLIGLLSNPLMRPLRKSALKMLKTITAAGLEQAD